MEILDNSGLQIKDIERRALILTVVMAVSFFIADIRPWAYGVILGGMMALINLRSISRTALRSLNTGDPEAARRIAISSGILRQIRILLILGIAFFSEHAEFLAAVVGLLTVKIVIITHAVAEKFKDMSLRGIQRIRDELERRN